MIIEFKRTLFTSQKSLHVYQDQEKIGSLRYYRNGNSRNPKYDVNIEAKGITEKFSIIQRASNFKEGLQWNVFSKMDKIGDMFAGKLTEVDQVKVLLNNDDTILIKARFGLKTNAHIYVNNNQIGEISIKGMLLNSYYKIHLKSLNNSINPILLAGIAYGFLSSSNNR